MSGSGLVDIGGVAKESRDAEAPKVNSGVQTKSTSKVGSP